MIIGISGKKQSGKDIVGKMIQYLTTVDKPSDKEFIQRHIEKDDLLVNPKFELKSFAHKVKQIAAIILGCNVEDFENEEFKNSKLDDIWADKRINKDSIIRHRIEFKSSNSKGEPITYRKALQFIGTYLFRNQFHPNTWINALFNDYTYIPSGNDHVEGGFDKIYPNWIITDVRFLNEAKAIEDRSGIIVRVNENRIMRSNDQHESETALDDYPFTHIINNNGTLEDLLLNVKNFIEICIGT